MSEIISLAERVDNATMWTPKQVISEAVSRISEGGDCCNVKKILVVYLDDKGEKYNTGFNQCGMSMSECVALCEIIKNDFISRIKDSED